MSRTRLAIRSAAGRGRDLAMSLARLLGRDRDPGRQPAPAVAGGKQRHRVERQIEPAQVEPFRELVELEADRTRLIQFARKEESAEQQHQELVTRLAPAGVTQAHGQRPGELQRTRDRAAREVELDDVHGRRKRLPLACGKGVIERTPIGGPCLRKVSGTRQQRAFDDRAVREKPRWPLGLLEPACRRQRPARSFQVVAPVAS